MKTTLRITIEIPAVETPAFPADAARTTAGDVLAMIRADENFDSDDTRVKVEFVPEQQPSGRWYQKATGQHFEASGESLMEVE